MPTIVLENVPAEVYERLERRAASRQRPLAEEAVLLLREALGKDSASRPLEWIPGEEIPAPYDLPRSSVPEFVTAYPGRPRPLELPEIREGGTDARDLRDSAS